jgi:hypothetical protein
MMTGSQWLKGSVLAACGALAAAMLAATGPAMAQEVQIAANKDFVHQTSNIRFKPKVGKFKRYRVVRFDSDNDVAANYERASDGTFATIYVTRVSTPDPYLWFHRVLGIIVQREGFTPMMMAGVQPEFFTAPGFDRPSGVQVSYAARGGQIRSSALAMMAYGDMMVKVRVSSPTLDRVELMPVMEQFIAGFAMPGPRGGEPEPYMVEDCADALQFANNAAQAKATKDTGLEQVMASLFSQLSIPADPTKRGTVRYCLDPASNSDNAIYRPDGSREAYLLSFNDTGSAIMVGPAGGSTLAALHREDSEFRKYGYGVVLDTPDTSYVFAPFDSLPTPDRVFDVADNGNVIATTDRAGEISFSESDD